MATKKTGAAALTPEMKAEMREDGERLTQLREDDPVAYDAALASLSRYWRSLRNEKDPSLN